MDLKKMRITACSNKGYFFVCFPNVHQAILKQQIHNSIGNSSTLEMDKVKELVLVTSKINLCALKDLGFPITVKLY